MKKICLENLDCILDSGFIKPICSITLDDRENLIQCIKKHICIFKTKAELDQLKTGLKCLGVGEAMENYPKLMASMFLSEETQCLTAGRT